MGWVRVSPDGGVGGPETWSNQSRYLSEDILPSPELGGVCAGLGLALTEGWVAQKPPSLPLVRFRVWAGLGLALMEGWVAQKPGVINPWSNQSRYLSEDILPSPGLGSGFGLG